MGMFTVLIIFSLLWPLLFRRLLCGSRSNSAPKSAIIANYRISTLKARLGHSALSICEYFAARNAALGPCNTSSLVLRLDIASLSPFNRRQMLMWLHGSLNSEAMCHKRHSIIFYKYEALTAHRISAPTYPVYQPNMPYEENNRRRKHENPNAQPKPLGRLTLSSTLQRRSKLSGSTRNRPAPNSRAISNARGALPVVSPSVLGTAIYASSSSGGWDVDKWLQSSGDVHSRGSDKSTSQIQYRRPRQRSHASPALCSYQTSYTAYETDSKESSRETATNMNDEQNAEGYYSDVSTVSSNTMNAMSANCSFFQANLGNLPTAEELSKRRKTYFIETLRFKEHKQGWNTSGCCVW